ncbi:unnamed protein product [Prorocentrum cordatum]|uniref:Uncharacterized protein n=1 Tax=Prorocentrum cordatum TaxID=2364126 RepID=A0ABN9XW32_9DINO|nr:unnamed protein product [Polarella glacialis]
MTLAEITKRRVKNMPEKEGEKERKRERERAVCVQGALARTEHAGGSRRYVWNYHVQSAHGRVKRVDQGQISEACESPGTAASEAEGERERESRENGDSSNCVSRARSHGGWLLARRTRSLAGLDRLW